MNGTLYRLAVVAVVLLGGCVSRSTTEPASTPSSTSSRTATTVSERCDEATPIDLQGPNGPEVVGVATDASLYGMLFPVRLPVRAGDELKIVWRMTGSGDLSIEVEDPSGQERDLIFGPEPHADSTYDRPGDEWGSGFEFDAVGCWHLRLTRDVGTGEVWIDVT